MLEEFQPLPDNGQRIENSEYSTTWVKYPYGVRLQEDPSTMFKSIKDYEDFVLEGDAAKGTIDEYNAILNSNTNSDLSGFGSTGIVNNGEDVRFFNGPLYTDTRVGCNDAMNPYWQFNRDDDIRPAMMFPAQYVAKQSFSGSASDYVADIGHGCGMGRVYSEVYDAQQQILWLEAGVPRFTNLLEFYRDAADADVAAAINQGTFSSFVGRVVGKMINAVLWAISLPVLAPFYLVRFVNWLACDRVTKYYSFQPAMTMYYETVNTMMQYVAISMGIHPFALQQHAPGKGSSHISNGAAIIRSVDAGGGKAVRKKVKISVYDRRKRRRVTKTVWRTEQQPPSPDNFKGIPEILKEGPDIFMIMNRRARMANLNSTTIKYNANVRDLVQQEIRGDGKGKGNAYFLPPSPDVQYKNDSWSKLTNFLGNGVKHWFGSLKGSVYGSGNQVGFRLERGVSASETFSNSTGQPGIAQKLNSVSEKYKEENESFGNSFAERMVTKSLSETANTGDGFQAVINNLTSEVAKGAGSTLAKITGFDIGSVLMSGNGFLDIPDVWKSSSFSKSYSFNIQLRSRYGDPVSVFQSIYIPMLMLMAFSAPRAIGSNMYTSPFLVRAYCRGMFAIPLGIVENMTIERGSDDFGWSSIFLPTSVNVSFGIKDLSPTLFLSMQENGIFDTFTRNSNLLEYLDTLAALGMKERMFFWPKMMRKAKTSLAIARTTIFSATYWGARMGRSNLGRAINGLVPFNTDLTPNN